MMSGFEKKKKTNQHASLPTRGGGGRFSTNTKWLWPSSRDILPTVSPSWNQHCNSLIWDHGDSANPKIALVIVVIHFGLSSQIVSENGP